VSGAAKLDTEKNRKSMAEQLSQQDVQRYLIAWTSYVTRRNLMIVLFVGFVPLGILMAKLKLGPVVSLAVVLGWIVIYLTGAWWLTEWKCPRCGRTFANRLWTQRCMSCGLTKDELAAMGRRK
jgi:hypothetical protein